MFTTVPNSSLASLCFHKFCVPDSLIHLLRAFLCFHMFPRGSLQFPVVAAPLHVQCGFLHFKFLRDPCIPPFSLWFPKPIRSSPWFQHLLERLTLTSPRSLQLTAVFHTFLHFSIFSTVSSALLSSRIVSPLPHIHYSSLCFLKSLMASYTPPYIHRVS